MSDIRDNPKLLAAALRDRLDVSNGHASELARGLKTPSFKLAIEAQDVLGIDPRWWHDNMREKV